MCVESLLVTLLMRLPWRMRAPVLGRMLLSCSARMLDCGVLRADLTLQVQRSLAWRLRIVEACLDLTRLEHARRFAGLPPLLHNRAPIDTSIVSPGWLAWRFVTLSARLYGLRRSIVRLAARFGRLATPSPRDAGEVAALTPAQTMRALALSG
jgi:hypothetical protein